MARIAGGTIGDRNPNRRRWSDMSLENSSAEELTAPSAPAPPLNVDSYVEPPERGLADSSQSGLPMQLKLATKLSNEPSTQQGARANGTALSKMDPDAAEFIPMLTKFISGEIDFVDGVAVAALADILKQPASGAAESDSDMEQTVASDRPSASRFRIRQKRSPLTTQVPAGKRPRNEVFARTNGSAPPARQEDSEEDWQRRVEKRQTVVAAVKTSAEYQVVQAIRAEQQQHQSAPTTPDPTDRSISKRRWETDVMHWRTDIRNLKPV